MAGWTGGDVESGEKPLLSNMILESSAIRWAFIRKVYSIVLFQLLLTAAVSAVVVFVRPVSHFFLSSPAGVLVYVAIVITQFIVIFPLYFLRERHPWNYLILGLYTVLLSLSVGLICAFTSGKVILEAVILTTAVVISLTLYTFWAARNDKEWSFFLPFLAGALTVLIFSATIQIFFPFSRTADAVYGFATAILFCAYIVYDTGSLINRYTYDEYIWAAVSLYLDIINLFAAIIRIFSASER